MVKTIMAIFLKLFMLITGGFILLVIFRNLWPKDPGQFSNFKPSNNNLESMNSQKAKTAPKSLSTRFPHPNMTAWEVLDVARNATELEIQTAFRKKISEFHPDKFNNCSKEEEALALQSSLLITKARDELLKTKKS